MGFDALTLAAVRDELAPLITEARIQRLVFVDEHSLAVEFFAPSVGRTNVLLSANLQQARVQRIKLLPARGVETESPFDLLVRKHLRNARVRSVNQPPLERVLELDCEQRDASGRFYRVRAIVEVMGRRSNLVLVDDDGMIIDAARRTPPSRNPRRPILPRLPYSPPPPQDRLFPEAISAQTLRTDGDSALAKHLADTVAGLSPLAAREIAFRATGATATPVAGVDWSNVASVTREFLSVMDTHQWSPCVVYEDGQAVDYAPYDLTHLAAKPVETISEAMDIYYARQPQKQRGDSLSGERKALFAPLERAAHAATRRIAALEHQLVSAAAERDSLRRAGELLLAHQTEVAPGAAEFFLAGDRIALDPTQSVIENAQMYFARYRKARETEERVPPLLEQARQTADYLAELRALVEVADQMDAMRALRREVASATGPGGQTRPTRAAPKPAYRRVPLSDGWEALVGTSANGNAVVTFEVARPEDLWFHARGVPGAHVILHGGRGDAPRDVVERAAQLAALHSAARGNTAVEVDVTPRRYVKKIAGGPPGLVRYANERTIRVTPLLA